MQIIPKVALAKYCSLGVGGKADFFGKLKNLAELPAILKFAKGFPLFWLGGGSNVFFADEGFRGLVIQNGLKGLFQEKDFFTVNSGEVLGNLVRILTEQNLAGGEQLAGIPGTVGGAVAGNANEIGQFLVSAEIVKTGSRSLQREVWLPMQCQFRYRFSALRNSGNFLLSAKFCFPPARKRVDLAQQVKRKQAKQPFRGTSGSWFKNPPGQKAWRLIAAVGGRGLQVGQARVSPLHANFFENLGGARASDFLSLEKRVQERVWQRFRVQLEREVIFVAAC